jgi:hypothetical protein
MANTAAHLVNNVLPEVPCRQWVLSFPRRVRFTLARDADLLSRLLQLDLDKIFAWQRRKARAMGWRQPMCGAVTFCQRFPDGWPGRAAGAPVSRSGRDAHPVRFPDRTVRMGADLWVTRQLTVCDLMLPCMSDPAAPLPRTGAPRAGGA